MSDEERESQDQEREDILDGENDVAPLGVVETLHSQSEELSKPQLDTGQSLPGRLLASSKRIIT